MATPKHKRQSCERTHDTNANICQKPSLIKFKRIHTKLGTSTKVPLIAPSYFTYSYNNNLINLFINVYLYESSQCAHKRNYDCEWQPSFHESGNTEKKKIYLK